MNKRLFVAIPLEPNIKSLLGTYKTHVINHPNITWVAPQNLHITLYFLGNVAEEVIPNLIDKINTVLLDIKRFSLKHGRIVLAPPNKAPKMIWVQFEKNKNYDQLCFKLQNAIQKYENKHKPSNHKELIPHITLARFKGFVNITQEDLKQIEIPEVDVTSCHLMESTLTPEGPVYETL